jgi:hypothetical protein
MHKVFVPQYYIQEAVHALHAPFRSRFIIHGCCSASKLSCVLCPPWLYRGINSQVAHMLSLCCTPQVVLGQQAAVHAVASAVRLWRMGLLQSDQRPAASFVFEGPHGVGKSLMSKVRRAPTRLTGLACIYSEFVFRRLEHEFVFRRLKQL